MADASDSKSSDDKQNLFILSRSALLRGLCYLIPIPFLDDFVAQRVLKHMVASLLQSHGRSYKAKEISVFYEGESKGCFAMAWDIAWGLIIKPIKKIFKTIFFVLAIRDMAVGIGSTLFLGRCLNRSLNRDRLSNEQSGKAKSDEASLEKEAALIYAAFQSSYAGSDKKVITQSVRAILKQSQGIGSWGLSAVKTLFGEKKESYEGVEALEGEDKKEVEKTAKSIAEVMEQEEFVKILSNFDRDFDEALSAARKSA